jgi:hypothetical protein
MWEVQAAVSWPHGHCCWWPRRLSRGQEVCFCGTAQGEAVIPPSRESAHSQIGKQLVRSLHSHVSAHSFYLPCVKVDIVDFNGSFLARVRDFAGANPIILVITKVIVLCIHSVFLYCPVLFFTTIICQLKLLLS